MAAPVHRKATGQRTANGSAVPAALRWRGLSPTAMRAAEQVLRRGAAAADGTDTVSAVDAAADRSSAAGRPRGMVNYGNSCYLNVVLQALMSVAAFDRVLHALAQLLTPTASAATTNGAGHDAAGAPAHTDANAGASVTPRAVRPLAVERLLSSVGCPLLGCFVRLHAEMRTGVAVDEASRATATAMATRQREPIAPSYFWEDARVASLLAQGTQEDAQELLTLLLDGLQQESVRMCRVLRRARRALVRGARDGEAADDSGRRRDRGDRESDTGAGIDAGADNAGTTGDEGGDPDRDSDETDDDDADADDANADENTHDAGDGDDDDGWETVGARGRSAVVRTHAPLRTFVSALFGGALHSELHRRGCKRSVTRDPFFTLSLDVHDRCVRRLDEALRLYMEPEHLDENGDGSEDDAVDGAARGAGALSLRGHSGDGGGAGGSAGARKHMTLDAPLPPVLVFHLKRFAFARHDATADDADGGAPGAASVPGGDAPARHANAAGDLAAGAATNGAAFGGAKVNKHVEFPTHLRIGNHVLSARAARMCAPAEREYALCSVVTHLGRQLAGGHYLCDVRGSATHADRARAPAEAPPPPPPPPVWYCCDDRQVSQVRAPAVLGRPAYLLVYVRRA